LALAADAVAAGDVVAASWRCCWRWRPMLLALAMLVALFVRGQTTPHIPLLLRGALRNVRGRGLRVVMRHRWDGLSDAMSVGENK